MTDEEKAEEYADKILSDSKYPFIFNKEKVKAYIIKVYLDSLRCCENAYNKGFTEGRKEKCFEQNNDGTIRPCEVMKENEQLKKEISVLLSCSNCPENKGGYICDKEYNDKCLPQKIEYIKELKDENAELKTQIEKMKSDVQELSNNKYYYLSQHTCKELLRRWN